MVLNWPRNVAFPSGALLVSTLDTHTQISRQSASGKRIRIVVRHRYPGFLILSVFARRQLYTALILLLSLISRLYFISLFLATMHFNSVLAVSATLFALGLAADPLAFTSWPKDVQAGKPVTLTWAGAVTDQVQ